MRKFQRMRIPEKAHPLVRELWRLMNHERISLADLAERAGLSRDTLVGWRSRRVPRVHDLEACFNVLGRTLSVVHQRDTS